MCRLSRNLVWESLQLPLYTIWTTGTGKQQAFAVLHCTVGDAMIAGLSLLVALALFARTTWPSAGVLRVYVASLALGVVYTIYSEWLNTSVRGSWAYSDLMPVVPGDRDGSYSALAMVRDTDRGAVDRHRSGALDRSGIQSPRDV